MSINQTPPTVTIVCDICGTSQTEDSSNYNNAFWEAGWGLYPRARKYKHKCRKCQPPSHRKAHDFVARKFPVAFTQLKQNTQP